MLLQLLKARYFGDKELNIDKICRNNYIAITYQICLTGLRK